MTSEFVRAMRAATRATRGGDPVGATRIIQQALAGFGTAAEAPTPPPVPRRSSPLARRPLLDPAAEIVEPIEVAVPPASGADEDRPRRGQRRRHSLGAVVRALDGFGQLRRGDGASTTAGDPPLPDGARFLTRSFTCAAGSRSYRLYLPASSDRPRGLIVMLHGCTQDATDFARGSGMNRVAEANGLAVAYPMQPRAANAAACWNWFEPAHQERTRGEPAILAGLTAALTAEFGLDREQVFVAGLSAGGAMAAVMGATHPELFGAVGVHSGLAYRAASDVVSAYQAMQGNAPPPAAAATTHPRAIVFHGSADTTVHPSNAERVLEAVVDVGACRVDRTTGATEGGRKFRRTTYRDVAGRVTAEAWRVEGAGHAWAGGDAGGSFTDPDGPDASAAMVRFFLEASE